MLRVNVLIGIILILDLTMSHAETLNIMSWGGAYEESQRQAYFKPFTAKTGIEIKVASYNGGLTELRQQVGASQGHWDLFDLVIADNLAACEQGFLKPIDHENLPPAPDGTPAIEDFVTGGLIECGVSQIISATVLAYNTNAFPGEKPRLINDLFDLKRFPGKRALQKTPIANLEWALLSYGVPYQDIYPLLSTKRGLRLAFARLNTIKKHIVWWQEGSMPATLLSEGKVVMASGYNGRFFHAAVTKKQPIEIIWHGQLYNYSTWGIPENAPNHEAALAFIRFATDTQRLADQAKYIAYGPARQSSTKYIYKHSPSGVDIRAHLPTYPANFQHAIAKDHQWYAKTQRRLTELFERWLTSDPRE